MTNPAATPRPDTREVLLDIAAREIHIHGYQAASIARILDQAGVTKGALYHHFASKQVLGYAALDERFAPEMRRSWIEPLEDTLQDPLEVLVGQIVSAGTAMNDRTIRLGCPVNNLAQEMSPIDEGFRARIEGLLADWREAIATALRRGMDRGIVVADTDPQALAAFIVASLEGCIGMAKNAQSHELLMSCGRGIVFFLRSLRKEQQEEG